MRRVIGWVAAVLLVVAAWVPEAWSQTPPAANTLVHATADAVTIHAGGTANAIVHVTVADGWHIYSNPPSLDYNIPTKVSIAGGAGVTGGKPKYPAGRAVKFASDEAPMTVYDGAFDVPVPLTAASDAVNGAHAFKGKVDFQACNDQMCLAPTAVPFTIEVTVEGGVAAGSVPPSPAASESTTAVAPAADTAAAPAGSGFMTAPPADGGTTSEAQRAELEKKLAKGMGWWLFWMFLGGLGLNLSPCVFPMLGITVSIFGARKAETTPRAVANAIAYVLGIMLMYTSLGLVAALTGRMFGAALQSPWVSLGIGVLLLGLSLSMFGFYEIQAPAWMLDRVGGANTGSLAGLFVSGLAVGVVAAPCVGSFIIGLLAVIGQRASIAFGLQSMGMLSLGLALPYLVLASSSNLLGKLPRAGDWMDWVKKLFGVVLASWGAFYVLLGVFPAHAAWLLPTALVLGGLYLGFMEKSGNTLARFRTFKAALGAIGVIAGVLLALQIVTAASRSITFKPYDEKAVAASLAAGRGVMIDFAADWCVPCHELELNVFPDKSVVAAAKRFDAYKADVTHGDTPASTKYAVHGVPTVIFLGRGGVEARAQRVEGYIPPAEFAKRLEAAGQGL